MNQYIELQRRWQQDFAALPIKYALSQEDLAKGMAEWGLEPTDTDKIIRTGAGAFYRKEDVPRLTEIRQRHEQELKDAIAADTTGDGFIFQMFYRELADHEFGFTMEYDETLAALGLTWEQVQADQRLSHGLKKAAHMFGVE